MRNYLLWLYTIFLCSLFCPVAKAQLQWTVVSSSTAASNASGFSSVNYGDGQWITVGSSGKIMTSIDGSTWTNRNSNTKEDLTAIAHRPGQWVAVGSNGTTITSPNGIDWTVHVTDPANGFSGVDFGADRWVAVGKTNNVRVGYGIMYTSTDGINWTNQPIAQQLSYGLNRVEYINNTWYLVGGNLIATSKDGLEWTPRSLKGKPSFVTSIAYGAGLYVAGDIDGYYLTSTDGINWPELRINADMSVSNVSYGDGYWLAVGNDYTRRHLLWASTDGTHWQGVDIPSTNSINAVHYANGRWVAVGGAYSILTSLSASFVPLGVLPSSSIRLVIYPNPGAGFVDVEAETLINSITVRSVRGTLVNHYDFAQPVTKWVLRLADEPAGTYFIQVQTSGMKSRTLPYIKY
ncbi:hypothetical protein FAES_0758 [Fibrella aestuarina BUZ 2]|uniref:Secretion system C-terminal sorting domain-containing protein n=1 Tax=Fibrella aestuarina BUZ 2 TaxID=1166018 RepID=I0K3R6_9BACT|nr:T9SS type A sorting domain-containing protein [Fibrella aestuarina]CCG98769.1 hypothetical protein FAES_0758 [Fibrella aestuarina BUZ 2]